MEQAQNQRVLRLINAIGFLFNVSYLLFGLLVPLVAVHRGLPVWIVGLLAGLPGVMQFPMRLLSGPLTDYLGERAMLLYTFALGTGAGFCAAFIPGPVIGLVFGQFFMGAARGAFWTAAQALVTRIPGDRASRLGVFTSFTKSGALVGVVGAGLLAELIGPSHAFIASSLLSLLPFGATLSLHYQRLAEAPRHFSTALAGLLPAALRPAVVVNGLVALLCAVPQSLALSFYPVVLIRLGLNPSLAATITALNMGGMIVAGLVVARYAALYGMRQLVLVSVALLGAGLLAMGVQLVWVLIPAIFAAGFAAGGLNVAFLTNVANASRDEERGTNLGMAQGYFVVAMSLTPFVSGLLAEAVGFPITFLVEGIASIGVLIGIMALWQWAMGQNPHTSVPS